MPVDSEASPLFCRIFGHRRTRRVWHEGDGYRTRCRRCGTDLFKLRGHSDWTAVSVELD